jgi:hypothetical protein
MLADAAATLGAFEVSQRTTRVVAAEWLQFRPRLLEAAFIEIDGSNTGASPGEI